MNTLKFLLLLSIFSITIHAQVNIEKYNKVNQSDGLFGNLSFYVSAKTGNTDIQEFGVDGRINYHKDSFNSFLIALGDYGWNNGKEYSNNALLHFRLIKETETFISPEFFAQINYNKKQLILFRSLIGVGVRAGLLSTENSNLTFGTAYMFEHEKLDLSPDNFHPSLTDHHRWSNYLSYTNSLTDNSTLSVIIYAQPRFDNFKDIRMLSENHLSVGLNEKVSISVSLGLRYDSKPPDTVKDLDTYTKIGLSIKI